jgi:DNA-binding transcriptional regulator YiaG
VVCRAPLGLPKIFRHSDGVQYRATRELKEQVQKAMAPGWTYEDIEERGGPTQPTLTKIMRGEDEPISKASAAKLDRAFGWPRNTAATLATGVAVDLAEHIRNGAMSASEIAARLHVSPKVVERWERGEAIPAARLAQLIDLLHEAPDEVLLAELTRRARARGVVG